MSPHTNLQSPVPIDEDYISALIYDEISDGLGEHNSNLLGETLTVIDASIVDPEQRKAIKDIIKKNFYSNPYYYSSNFKFILASLSKFLRQKRNTSSTEEEEEYENYIKAAGLDRYTDLLFDRLNKAILG